MNSDHGPQKGRSPRLAVARRVSILLAAVCVSRIAFADPYWAPRFEVSLSRSEQRALERVACEPLNVRLRTSIATRWESETRASTALARCAPHATLYGNPVMFERGCGYEGSWNCEKETEEVFVRYPDRQVYISAKDMPLTEAYWIVSYLMLRKDFERPTPPTDTCTVEPAREDEFRAVDEYEFHVKCWLGELRLKTILSRTDGITRYQKIPLRECATKDNPACLYGPVLSLKEFPGRSSGAK